MTESGTAAEAETTGSETGAAAAAAAAFLALSPPAAPSPFLDRTLHTRVGILVAENLVMCLARLVSFFEHMLCRLFAGFWSGRLPSGCLDGSKIPRYHNRCGLLRKNPSFLAMMRSGRRQIPSSSCRLSVLLGLAATGGGMAPNGAGIGSCCAAAAAGTSCARSGYVRSSSVYASFRPSSSLHGRASPVSLCCFGSLAVAITASRQSGHTHGLDMRCPSHSRPANSGLRMPLRNGNRRRPWDASRRCLTTSAS